MNSRELVNATLEMRNHTGRPPRQLWTLPWAQERGADTIARISSDFPPDFTSPPNCLRQNPPTKGNLYDLGESMDEWGSVFYNIHPGVVGEVKTPAISPEDEDWSDLSRVHFPEEWLTLDVEKVNAFCASTDKFVMAGCNPRPFEQLQFLRGTEQLYMDLVTGPSGMRAFMERMHDLFCRQATLWAQTDVDAISFMDDWGSQRALLINPKHWDEYFKPMYRDYIDIAHKYGKKAFMHSDGYIMEIIPRLIDLGLDALNSQIFCMGVGNLAQYAGRITFWGEIDRQHLLSRASLEEIDAAVEDVRTNLWRDGGCIAQCEYGPGCKGENVYRVFQKWAQWGE